MSTRRAAAMATLCMPLIGVVIVRLSNCSKERALFYRLLSGPTLGLLNNPAMNLRLMDSRPFDQILNFAS